ncbi:unnamed protein product [Mytilus coruscus]|uniref:Uncharacterized protein n=1 Tax=Mytilus coruscus TaxID=42192 RepID=A0A6J8BNJ1_MYTCO|nr:unnamed protein product [Mytilus coruscus]
MLEPLKRKRIINQTQWDKLFPNSGIVSSNSFDMTLMICLLRHLISEDVGEFLPIDPKNLSVGADLSRLKYYRNQIAHSDAGVLPDKNFENYWKDITQAIVRLGGVDFQQRCDDLKVSRLDDSEMEILAEIRSLYSEYDPVHKGLREINGEEIEEWKQVIVAETRAVKRIAVLIRTEGVVMAVGSSGCGKSTAIHHVALQLCNHDGYDIIPVYVPDEIRQYYNPECKQVFVIDDICGKSSIDICMVNRWERLSSYIKKILKHSEVKILSSCRNYIYRDRLFQGLTFFSNSTCDFTSNYSLTYNERMEIAHIYLSAGDVKFLDESNFIDIFDFFPLLCKMYPNQTYNIQNFFSNPLKVIEDDLKLLMNTFDQKSMATLMLFIAYNNCLNEKLLMQTSSLEPILKIISNFFHLQTNFSVHVVRSELDNLTQSYVKRVGNSYCIIQDKIFDNLILFFGEYKLDLVLSIAHTCIIRDRFILKSLRKDSFEQDKACNLIHIPGELEQTYFNRLLRDIENGFITNTFSNKQLKYENFRKNFFHFPGSDKSMKDILLHLSQYEIYDLLLLSIDQGYFDIVSLLLNVGKKLQCMICKNPPVYRATVKGYIDIVKLLLDYNFNPAFMGDDGQPLQVAVEKGFDAAKKGDIDIAKLLTHYKRNPTIEEWKKTCLYTAAENGHMNIVKLLIYDNVDPNITWEGNPLTIASNNGFTDIVNFLLAHKANPNIKTSWGTPLFRAAMKGHIDIMKLLLVNKASPDTDPMDRGGNPLFIATKKGYIDIVKLLLDNKASQNFMDAPYESPLSIATVKDIVKLFLEHMTHKNQSATIRNAGRKGYSNIMKLLVANKALKNYKSLLSIAAAEGHIDIVKLFLEHDSQKP